MFRSWRIIIGLLFVAVSAAGCQNKTPPVETVSSAHNSHAGNSQHDDKKANVDEDKISSELSKLGPEDRQLAESQKFCAVMNHERLGAMGAPVKLDIKGQPVFVCCKGCQQKATKNPDETLEKVAAMKANNETVHP